MNKSGNIACKSWLALLAALACICACGDEATEAEQDFDETGVPVIEKGMPLKHSDCTKNSIGDVVYVADSAAVYYCTTYGWRHLTGKDGRNGKNGKDGKDGTDGADGKPGLDGVECHIASYEDGYAINCGSSQDAINLMQHVPGTCTISSVSSSGFKITCGDKSVQQKAGASGEGGEDCKIRQLDSGAVEFACVNDTVIVRMATCGGKPYNPETEYCALDTVRTAEEYKKYKKCWEQPFVDWTNHFCDTRDYHIYRFTTIGNQVWMAENLMYSDSIKTPSLINSVNCRGMDNYYPYVGCYYRWSAAIDSVEIARNSKISASCGYNVVDSNAYCLLPATVRGICPEGWHLPSAYEFAILIHEVDSLSDDLRYKGRVPGSNVIWEEGNDKYGFSVFPPPDFDRIGDIRHITFWSTKFSKNQSTVLYVNAWSRSYVELSNVSTHNMAYVRCLRD